MHCRRTFMLMLLLLVGFTVSACTPEPKGLQGSVATVDFGSCFVGTTVTRQLHWVNADNTQSYDMEGVAKSGDGQFRITAPVPFHVTKVAPGSRSPVVTVAFAPTEQKRYQATLSPRDRAGAVTHQAIGLTGEGVYTMASGDISLGGGDIRINAPLDFGDVVVGRTVTSRFRLYNSGNAAASLSASWVMGGLGVFSDDKGGSAFSIDAQTPDPSGFIGKPGKVDVTLSFTPNATSKFSDAVIFIDASGHALAGVAVQGTGVKAPEDNGDTPPDGGDNGGF